MAKQLFKENEQMFGRKLKFACLALTSCMVQLQFLGCSQGFAEATLNGFTQNFGRAIGTAVGTSVGGLLDLGTLLGGLDLGGLLGA